MLCGRDEDPVRLEIDHINGNASDHWASNLRLVHHSCNARHWNQGFQSGQRVSHQPKEENMLPPPQLQLEPVSPEVRLNREYEPVFRRMCLAQVKDWKAKGETGSKSALRIEAREYVGCSREASYSYMERLFAPNGPLEEEEDQYAGAFYVRFRDPQDNNLTIEELEKKYPKEGRRFANDPSLR